MKLNKKRIRNLHWLSDDCGDFWNAEEVDETGHRINFVGSYYDLTGERSRLSRAKQEVEIGELFEVIW